MNRRGFLKRGLLGGFLLATASSTGLALFPSRKDAIPRGPLKILDPRGFAVLAAVAARAVQAPGVDPVAIAHAVDDVMARQVPEVQHDFRQLLLLFENALSGLLFDGRLRPFTRLSPEGQDAVLAAWRDSRITIRRAGYKTLVKLTQAAHYGQPACWASVGYPGPPQLATPT